MTYKTFAFYQISVGAHKQIFLLVNSHLLLTTLGVPGLPRTCGGKRGLNKMCLLCYYCDLGKIKRRQGAQSEKNQGDKCAVVPPGESGHAAPNRSGVSHAGRKNKNNQ